MKHMKIKKIYVSIIQDIVDDELIISAPVKNGKIIPLEIGTSYMISIYTKGGLFNCKAKVSKRIKKKSIASHYALDSVKIS